MAKNTAGSGGGHAQASIAGMVLLRIFLGAFFLYIVFTDKIGNPGAFTHQLAEWTRSGGLFVAGNQWPAFGTFLAKTVYPNAQAVAWLLIFSELLVGAMLLVGLLTRLAGLGALVLSTLYTLATFHLPAEFWGNGLAFAVASLAVIIAAAGRTWGIDAFIAQRTKVKLLW